VVQVVLISYHTGCVVLIQFSHAPKQPDNPAIRHVFEPHASAAPRHVRLDVCVRAWTLRMVRG